MSKQTSSPSAPAFHTTRWTMVMRARGDTPAARAALGELCEAYWMPVYRFLMREGKSADEGRELTQEFIGQLLATSALDKVDSNKGRFRSYLLGAVKNFLAKKRRAEGRQKRGGNAVIVSIDSDDSGVSPALEILDHGATPSDAYFDRHWALAVMERGLTVVEDSCHSSGKAKHFELLKPWLMGDADGSSQQETAVELGMTVGAVKVAIHRFRQKFAEAIRAEIAETVDTETEIQEELRYLIEALKEEQAAPSSDPRQATSNLARDRPGELTK
jgi:RNA polymerase sigma-70 factor (ECF subfamily)